MLLLESALLLRVNRLLANMCNIITMNKDYTLITIVINMILMLNITTMFTRMLANLRNMALDMNAEIRDQNEQMDRITEKVKISLLKKAKLTLLICIFCQ